MDLVNKVIKDGTLVDVLMVMGFGDLEKQAILTVVRFGSARCHETAAELIMSDPL